jgi:transcriptional regulator with XRE-family HTH domain
VKDGLPVSEQLKQRRLALGLSLAEVARRAGTSAATLSRYENGWTRFETYTLRKLAAALGCALEIELKPRRGPDAAPLRSPAEAVSRLQRLFWEHKLGVDDLEERTTWVVERVLEYGDLEDVRMLCDSLGKNVFLRSAAAAARVSPRTRNFWSQILELEGMECTRKYSRNTAWNC